MTLAESSARFLAGVRKTESDYSQPQSLVLTSALSLLTEYFPPGTALSEITPATLRDFLARWYVEKACASASNAASKPGELLSSLAKFFKWIDQQTGSDLAERSTQVLDGLRQSLPRAFEITTVLSNWLRSRGGAFGFPEFLTSFEEGGRSQYDIDTPGNVGALEGYFRILRVEGSSIEAEELISEERVWPIVFPQEVAALLDDQYIINLELVRSPAGWLIGGCGFAYPPGTDL